ncbi:MAG: phospholipase D family protein [Lysobacterales bacterium]
MRWTIVLWAGWLLLGCSAHRPGLVREYSYAYPPAEFGTVAARVGPLLPDDRISSGLRLVPGGIDAFALRAISAENAALSLDLQYYIWRDDLTGQLLSYEVMAAADRGVRVRLLIDDLDARGKSQMLASLDLHPNIEVRVFNPWFTRRGWIRTSIEFLARGSRVNRRMHNKLWLVDTRIALIGGRNIGDEYFDASPDVNFEDLDLVIAGQLVADAAEQFDRYWNDALAIPVSYVRGLRKSKIEDLQQLRERLTSTWSEAQQSTYVRRMREAAVLQDILSGRTAPVVTQRARLLVDDPRKADPDAKDIEPGVREALLAAMHGGEKTVQVISPYFVPGRNGTEGLLDLERTGVEVEVLTNSLDATDVAFVHSGYIRYRRPLLEGGVQLYELKPNFEPGADRQRLGLGSSKASLHTKAAIIDDRSVFVGSFNLDPRSARLNCEMGVLLDSRELARHLAEVFDGSTDPSRAYEVQLDDKERMIWVEGSEDEPVIHRHEPAGLLRRALTQIIRWLPIEPLL